MFFPQKMKKVDLILLKKDVDSVSKEVVHFGDFQVIEIAGEKAKKFLLKKTPMETFTAKFIELDRRINFLNTVFNGYSFTSVLGEEGTEKMTGLIPEEELEKKIREIETELNNYNKEMEEVSRRKTDIEIKIKKVNFFSGFDLEWSRLKDLKYFFACFGIIPTTSYEGFTSAMSTIPSDIRIVDTIESDILVFFASPLKYREKIDNILKNVYFRDYGLPFDLDKESKNKLVRYAFDLSFTLDEIIWLEKKYRNIIVKYLPLIRQLKKNIQYYLSISKLKGEMVSTERIFLFSGWVPADSTGKLKISIEELTKGRCVFLEEDPEVTIAKEGIFPPTKLSNPAFIRPFESLVNTFGVPNYREIDPTPLAALAYVIMYGAMFGDIGHGLVLASIGLIGTLFKKFRAFRNFAMIMFYVGISATIFGILYGSIFGHENIMKAVWISPAEHIMDILMIAIGFGAFILLSGIVLSMINSFREKNFGRLFFAPNGIPGLLFYTSLLYIGVCVLKGKSFSSVSIVIIIASLIVVMLEKNLEYILHKSQKKKHFIEHKEEHQEEEEEKPNIFIGLIEVFETVIAYVSKTISFMRVGAFALNHGALMSAFFILAAMSNVTVIQWLIVLIGNIFVIGFEGGIVAIQSIRLEFYEFFVNFFRANGKQFEGLGIYKDN